MNGIYELLTFVSTIIGFAVMVLAALALLDTEFKISFFSGLIGIVFLLTGYGFENCIGLDHNVDQENLIMSSPDNIKTAWSQLVHDDIINTASLINEKGIDRNLNANVDHVMGLDVVKKNQKDSIVRLDYIERVSMPDNQYRYDVHKDIVLMSNKGVNDLRYDIYEDKVGNLPDKVKTSPEVQKITHDQNMERLRDILNSNHS